jgi:hypothetical protein
MPEISDVELMQLADGTLPEPVRQRVEALVAMRPDLQQRVAAFRTTGKALARLFDPVTSGPVPDRLVDAIWRHAPPPPPRTLHRLTVPSRWESFAAKWLGSQGTYGGLAYAALAAIIVGAGWWLAEPSWHQAADIAGAAPPGVSLALDRTPSDKVAEFELAGRGVVALRVENSFRHRDGRYCRQFELELEPGKGSVGIACRIASGGWSIEDQMPSPVSVGAVHKKVAPAGSMDEGARGKALEAMDAAATRMSVGDVLQSNEEAKLIANGWHSSR